jgi:hypothetical protein
MFAIGSARRDAVTLFQKFGLAPFRAILPPEEFASVARQTDCAPQRHRPLIPEVVAWLMMYVGLHTTSMTQGVAQAWGWVPSLCPGLALEGVTEEAFCQARRRLTLRFWKMLWDRLVRRYEQRFDAALRWKGYWRVWAIDGSQVILANSPRLAQFFGRPRSAKGAGRHPQGTVVAMCSVFTGFCRAFKFVPLRFGERTALRGLLRGLRACDLVLLDRGFFSLCPDLAPRPTAGPVPDAPVGPDRGVRPEGAMSEPL